MWATADKFYNSMKWHLADATTLEEYEEPHPWKKDKLVKKTKIAITCANAEKPWIMQAKVREKINIYQANVCAYCRKKVLKGLGMDKVLEA